MWGREDVGQDVQVTILQQTKQHGLKNGWKKKELPSDGTTANRVTVDRELVAVHLGATVLQKKVCAGDGDTA